MDVIQNFYDPSSEGVFEVSNEDMVHVIESLGLFDSIDWDLDTFVKSINVLSTKRPTTNNILILRYNRNLSKGTGTMLSPDDRKLAQKYTNDIVLTLYLVNGHQNKGWVGSDFWMPNIKLPNDLDFWNTK